MKFNSLTLFLISTIVFSSCSDNNDSNNFPITSANITGSVLLYNEGTLAIENSIMTVTLEGTTPLISANTAANGNFTLNNVPFGTYTVIYEKEGFGTFKKFNLVQNNTAVSIPITDIPSLGQSSSTEISNLSVSVVGNDAVISVTTTPGGNSGNRRYIRYFLSNSPNVSAANYRYASEAFTSQINPKDLTITSSVLSSSGFSAGDVIYVKAYGDSYYSNKYNDTNLGRIIFPNLNIVSAAAVSFTMP